MSDLINHKLPATGDGKGATSATTAAGANSLAEILSQPECWAECLSALRDGESLRAAKKRFGSADRWLFVGCGSSYYVALAAAATMNLVGRAPAQAIPASELLLFPEATLASAKQAVAVLISRSGRTSEVIKAASLLRTRGIPTLAITCAPQQPLQDLADQTIVLAPADERSTVMTRSFSSMLLCLQALASETSGDAQFFDSLCAMPGLANSLVRAIPHSVRNFADSHDFSDYICLGQGPFYGLACECALKLTEMSLSYAQSFHTLEFRHGPKSIVGRETLLLFLLSDSGYEAERDVLEEMKSLGGTTLVIANKADERVRADSDLLIELSLDLPELARLAPTIVAGQLLGLYTGLRKGLNPDSPRNLSRVVMLEEQPSKAI